MDVVSYSDARANLKRVLDRVADDHEEIVVSRRNGGAVVMVSLEDWNATQTTLRLLSSPRNAERLRASIAQMDAGKGVVRDPIEP